MRDQLVFDRKSGKLGIKKKATEKQQKEMGCNYVVDVIDPINFKVICTGPLVGTDYDWHGLPSTDPRVRYRKMFDIIYEADWYFSGYQEGDGIVVEEYFIENQYDVFEAIRKIFG